MITIISIHLSTELDLFLRGGNREAGRTTEPALDLGEVLAKYKLKPEPLFRDPRARMPEHIWHAACPDDKAPEVVEKLLRIKGVEGAYLKPPNELPGLP
jgi:hypothetical protein